MRKMQHTEIWAVTQTLEGNAVLLRPRGSDIVVPIVIGQLEGQSILIGKGGIKLPRPLTHDLFLKLFASQGLFLERIEIHSIIENTFHARLVIIGKNYSRENPLVLDSRPSDALALAVRCKCPILVSSEIIEETGLPMDIILETQESSDEVPLPCEAGIPEKKNFMQERTIRMLQEQLNAAVEKEEYEQAAEIRDMIRKMEDPEGEI